AALEVDDDLVDSLGDGLPRSPALALPGGPDGGDAGRRRIAVDPVERIRDLQRVAGAGRGFRGPVGDDVVEGLVPGGDLDELHRAASPAPVRLDPCRRAPVIEGAV